MCVCNDNQLEDKGRENSIYNSNIKDKNTWK